MGPDPRSGADPIPQTLNKSDQTLAKTSVPLVPPKPNEFFTA